MPGLRLALRRASRALTRRRPLAGWLLVPVVDLCSTTAVASAIRTADVPLTVVFKAGDVLMLARGVRRYVRRQRAAASPEEHAAAVQAAVDLAVEETWEVLASFLWTVLFTLMHLTYVPFVRFPMKSLPDYLRNAAIMNAVEVAQIILFRLVVLQRTGMDLATVAAAVLEVKGFESFIPRGFGYVITVYVVTMFVPGGVDTTLGFEWTTRAD